MGFYIPAHAFSIGNRHDHFFFERAVDCNVLHRELLPRNESLTLHLVKRDKCPDKQVSELSDFQRRTDSQRKIYISRFFLRSVKKTCPFGYLTSKAKHSGFDDVVPSICTNRIRRLQIKTHRQKTVSSNRNVLTEENTFKKLTKEGTLSSAITLLP